MSYTSLYLLWCICEYSNIRNFPRPFKEYIGGSIQSSKEHTVTSLLHTCLCVCLRVCVYLVKGTEKGSKRVTEVQIIKVGPS